MPQPSSSAADASGLVHVDGARAEGLEPVLQADVLGDGCPALPAAGAEGLGRPPRQLRRSLLAQARGRERQVEAALRGIGLEAGGVESGDGSRQLVDDVLVEAGHGHHLAPGDDLGVDAVSELLQLLLGFSEVPERAGQVAAPGVHHRPVVHDICGEARQVGGAVDALGVIEVTVGLVEAAEVQPGHGPVVQGAGAVDRTVRRQASQRSVGRSDRLLQPALAVEEHAALHVQLTLRGWPERMVGLVQDVARGIQPTGHGQRVGEDSADLTSRRGRDGGRLVIDGSGRCGDRTGDVVSFDRGAGEDRVQHAHVVGVELGRREDLDRRLRAALWFESCPGQQIEAMYQRRLPLAHYAGA